MEAKTSKPLSRSLTVVFAVLTAIGYLGARYAEASADVVQGIVVVGVALTAVFLRRAIRTSKPLYRSMTVASALLMVAAYFAARLAGASPKLLEAILIAGVLAIVVYLRRALIGIYGDKS